MTSGIAVTREDDELEPAATYACTSFEGLDQVKTRGELISRCFEEPGLQLFRGESYGSVELARATTTGHMVGGLLSGIPRHEHVHRLVYEYVLSDLVLGTGYGKVLDALIDGHGDAGIVSRYAAASEGERLAELGSQWLLLGPRAVEAAQELGRLLTAWSGRDSQERVDRQRELVALAPAEWMNARLSHRAGELTGCDADERFMRVVGFYAERDGIAVGREAGLRAAEKVLFPYSLPIDPPSVSAFYALKHGSEAGIAPVR